MSLHARTEITTAGWSLISNAAVQIGNDDIFEITNDGTHFWNGIPNADLSQKKMAQRFPIATWQKAVNITKPDGEVLNTIRSTFKIYLGNDDNIEFIVFKNLIFVRVNAILQDSEGMLGIQGTVGMIGRDGNTILSDPIAMGMEWQVTDTEPILFREVRAPQYPEQCMLPKVDSRRLRGVSEEQRRLAEMACEGVPQEFQDFCRDDVLLTGDVTIVHGYAEAF